MVLPSNVRACLYLFPLLKQPSRWLVMEPNRPSRCDMKKSRDLTFYHPAPPGHISLVAAHLHPVYYPGLPSVCFAECLLLPCPSRPPLSKEENETDLTQQYRAVPSLALSSASRRPPSTTGPRGAGHRQYNHPVDAQTRRLPLERTQ